MMQPEELMEKWLTSGSFLVVGVLFPLGNLLKSMVRVNIYIYDHLKGLMLDVFHNTWARNAEEIFFTFLRDLY